MEKEGWREVMGGDVRGGARLRGRRCRFERGAASEREGALWADRCRCGRVGAIAQNLRGAGGRCVSVGVFCEAGVDRAFTASQRISSGWWGRVGVEGKDGGCDGKRALPVGRGLWL